nr:hypothetical protein [Tanacetum cinerariifolium]
MRTNEPYHRVENDKVVKSIFNSGKTKRQGMRIPDSLLTEEIKQTNAFKCSKETFIIRIPKRKQPNPETLIRTATQTELQSLIEAKQVNYTLAKSAKEYEAQQNVKSVEDHLLDEDVNRLVKGEEYDTDKFADEMMLSQEDPNTRIYPGSHKESPKTFRKILMGRFTTRETGVDQPPVENDKVVKSIFNSGKTKRQGMRIPDSLLTEEIKQTNAFKCSKETFIIRIPKRKQPNPETLIRTATQTELQSLIEAKQVSYTLAKSAKEYEAQQNVKSVEDHLLDEDVNRLVKGEEYDTDKFADEMMLSQEDPNTRIYPGSHKESPKVQKVAKIIPIDEEV